MERPASSTLPTTPGIYIYKDAQGRIIYVGKARNLRKRILSYFRDASALTPKTVAMIGHAASLETLSTTTEKEALLLEASLIKKHRPPRQRPLFRPLHLGAGGPRDMEDHPPGLPLTALRGPGLQKPRPALPLPSYRAVSRAVHGKRPR